MALLPAEGWARWSPEVPSSLDFYVIYDNASSHHVSELG